MGDFWLPVLVEEGDTFKVETDGRGFYEFTVVDVSDGEVTVEHRKDLDGNRQRVEVSLFPKLVNRQEVSNISIMKSNYRKNDRNL